MNKELKTLKDIRLGCYECDIEEDIKNPLREEAIKWAKKNKWFEGNSITQYDWLDFFNLKEDDLK